MVFPLITENDKMLPIYITGIGNQNPQPKLERIKGFPSHQIFLITNGKGVFYTDKTHFHIKKGDILFVPKNVYHGYYPTQTPFSNRWVSFDGANTEQIFQYLSLKEVCKIESENFAEFYKDHKEMLDIAENDMKCDIALLSAMFYKYMFRLFLFKDNGKQKTYIEATKEYMRNNFNRDISLDELAAKANVSKYKLCKEFKKAYRVTLFEYLMKVRIQQAKYLLIENTNMKIKEIAERTGFHDTSYFIKIFKEYETVTPVEYRENGKG